MTGRPSSYTEDLASAICTRIADGETLKQICRDDNMPPESTVRTWVLDDREGFSARYARAREMQFENMADEILDLPDSFTGQSKADTAKLREQINSRKWLLSKLKPERYGDSLKLSGELDLNTKTDEQLAARLAQLLSQTGSDRDPGGDGAPEEPS